MQSCSPLCRTAHFFFLSHFLFPVLRGRKKNSLNAVAGSVLAVAVVLHLVLTERTDSNPGFAGAKEGTERGPVRGVGMVTVVGRSV